MNGQDDSNEKQYEPTQKKLDDARKKGEFARSADLTTAAGYGGLLIASLALGPAALLALGNGFTTFLDQSDSLASLMFAGHAAAPTAGIIMNTAWSSAPFFVGPAILACLSIAIQRGFAFTPSKLEPKLSRISPLSGLKNKFGRTGLFEFFKSFAKLSIYSVILGVYLTVQMPRILSAIHLSPALITAELLRMITDLLLIVLVVALVIGALDYLWQIGEHRRKNRMSRQDMTDEVKQSEGDPYLKNQRRQKGMSLVMSKMIADVPRADVIIVNPTHYAVALAWDRSSGRAPVCIASGVDEIALRIRALAAEHHIPIHADPPTARALYASVAVGEEIRPDHFGPVAAAIRFAEAMRKKASRQ